MNNYFDLNHPFKIQYIKRIGSNHLKGILKRHDYHSKKLINPVQDNLSF